MDDPRFNHESLWTLEASVAQVWQALTEVEQWPRWWPYLRRVETVHAAAGVGAVRRLHWRTRLPYGFTLLVTCTEAQRERRLVGRSAGDLSGEGAWELQPVGPQTHVRYTWRLDVNKPWMRRFAPLLAPLFAWNHHGVMRAGERGLRRWLSSQR
jgi:uncharacterized protein YndB with AHSA1/START domain